MVDLAKFPKEGDGKTTHEKIVREIAIMEDLKHPNVCQIHDTFFEKGDSTVSKCQEILSFEVLLIAYHSKISFLNM